MKISSMRLGLAMGAALACGSASLLNAQAPSAHGAKPAPAQGGTSSLATIVMTRVNASAGLTNMYTTGNTHTNGAAWIDYNNDYFADLFITNGSGYDHRLYRNEGDGTFTDVSSLVAKPDLALESASGLFADVDNDGDHDLVVIVDSAVIQIPPAYNPPEGGPNLFYLNQGDGTFLEIGSSMGVIDPRGRRNICGGFADYDRDGLVDLFLGCWAMNSVPEFDRFDRLMHNEGGAYFSDASQSTRVDGYGRDSLVALWYDADYDGWIDLYVGKVGGVISEPDNNDILYLNHHQGTRFCDGTGDPHKIGDDAKADMGMDVGDIDNDGDWDFYNTDIIDYGAPPFGNVFYLGNPDGRRDDNTADVAGISANSSWPCNFADFDRDGFTDLWVGSADPLVPSWLYLNDKDGTFTDQALPSFAGLAARGGSIADYDADGDMDVVIVTYEQDSELMRNDTVDGNNWLEVRLFGTTSNRDAIGAVLKVTNAGKTLRRRVSGGDSAHSQMDLVVHFGLALQATTTLTVEWPNGGTSTFPGVATNQIVFVDETLGLLSESLPASTVTWSASSQELAIDVRSSFGGRTGLTATGFGSLAYDAALLTHGAQFGAVAANPGTVTLTSTHGGSFTLPVVEIP